MNIGIYVVSVISLIKVSNFKGINFLLSFDSTFPEFLLEDPFPEEEEWAEGALGFYGVSFTFGILVCSKVSLTVLTYLMFLVFACYYQSLRCSALNLHYSSFTLSNA